MLVFAQGLAEACGDRCVVGIALVDLFKQNDSFRFVAAGFRLPCGAFENGVHAAGLLAVGDVGVTRGAAGGEGEDGNGKRCKRDAAKFGSHEKNRSK